MRLQRGFTLLELLIAIAIFALLALATYRMFDSVMQTDQATRVQEQRMRELVRAMGALERDLTQAVERPVRDELGDNRGAFLSEGENDQIVELTRGGWRNPLGQARSRLQRVRWSLSGETLERRYWLVLDRAQDSKPRVQQVLDGVTALSWRFLDKEHNWQGHWPTDEGSEEERLESLPLAVEMTLEPLRQAGARLASARSAAQAGPAAGPAGRREWRERRGRGAAAAGRHAGGAGMRRGQNGVALITVLLVVAVVTIVCAGLIIRQQLAIRSSANQLHVRQAWHYALGGERLAEAVLRRDLRQGGENTREPVDHLGEAWARPMTPFKLDDGGELRVRIEDPSGRFNLNGLVRKRKVKPDSVKQFRRLLATLGMKEEIVQGLPDRLADWLDADQNPQGEQGAEDNQYLLEAPAYRAANRSFKDVSELRLLKLSEADYRRLLPFVSALPEDAPLNVNTASVPVLAAMFEIDPGQAENIVDARGREGFQSKDDFTKHLTQLGSKTGNVSYAVGTRYFQVISEVSLGDRRQVLVSTLQRGKDGKIRVMARDMGQGGLPIPSTGGDDWKKDER